MGRRKKQSGFEALAALPWPLGLVAGIVGYLGVRYGIGWWFSHHLPNTPAQGRSSAAIPPHRLGQSVASLDRETRNRRIELERQFGRRHASLLGDDQPR